MRIEINYLIESICNKILMAIYKEGEKHNTSLIRIEFVIDETEKIRNMYLIPKPEPDYQIVPENQLCLFDESVLN